MKTTVYDGAGLKIGSTNADVELEIDNCVSKGNDVYTITEIQLIRNAQGTRRDVYVVPVPQQEIVVVLLWLGTRTITNPNQIILLQS